MGLFSLYKLAIDTIPTKDKLEVITGIPAQNQLIFLLDSESSTVPLAQLTDHSRELSQYGLRDWQVLKVRKYALTAPNEADQIRLRILTHQHRLLVDFRMSPR